MDNRLSTIDFTGEMYTSPVGSYVISVALISGKTTDKDIQSINARWQRIKKRHADLDVFDVKRIAELFELPYITDGIACFISNFNVAYSPIIRRGDDIVPISIQRTGILTTTQKVGRCYPLKEEAA